MSSMKEHKKLEERVNSALYDNVTLLTLQYPTTKEFIKIFKKDMFLKPNKEAFQEVYYFLLKTLDPNSIQKFIPSWPILNKTMETSFRNEVYNYLNQLNQTYKDSGFPTILKSHLMLPGGFKFAHYTFLLSQFVLEQHLHKDPVNRQLLRRIKPGKTQENTVKTLGVIEHITEEINKDVVALKSEFELHFEEKQIKADRIISLNVELDEVIPKRSEKLEALQEQLRGGEGLQETKEMMKTIEGKLEHIGKFVDKCERYRRVAELLRRDRSLLAYNEVADLNLMCFLEQFQKYLEAKKLNICSIAADDLRMTVPLLNQAKERMEKINVMFEEVTEQFKKFADSLNLKWDRLQ